LSSLAICGNVAIDHIDGRPPKVGGGPFHCGHGLRLLERRGRIVAKCAREHRHLLVPPLTALGVPLTILDAEHTAEFGLYYEGEQRRTEIRALGDPWRPEDLAALEGIQWVHVAPLARSDFPAATLAELARGRHVSYDGQGLVRSAAVGPVRLDANYDPELLAHVSFLKLAEEEAETVLPSITEEHVFALGVREVVLTLGTRGSIVYAAGHSVPVPCHPIRDVDVTGCGDAFAVGYLAARSDGVGPVAAARRATALVALLLTNRKRALR
jgi:sugar/nucleoside kinase (ribokinase family)